MCATGGNTGTLSLNDVPTLNVPRVTGFPAFGSAFTGALAKIVKVENKQNANVAESIF